MAPISPGNMSGPPRRPKKPTATTKAHRFEPFTNRIAKIKIDPVHTVQKSRITEDHNDLSKSFFRSALDEWAELNLSRTFTSFLNKASPLSESLPQLLHHSDALFALLLEHIGKKDEVALEPLLSLTAHFAHDLGQVFEKYFAQTVSLVAQVSANVDDPAAIESCFTCLTWMFKYLSRTLVQDLRPLLEITIPYMSSRKEYVRRFTAESLAFLTRKAAVMYSKKPDPLQRAIQYLFQQLVDRPDDVGRMAYENALMTLITESAIGVDVQLHSSASDLMDCVLNVVVDSSSNSDMRGFEVAEGSVVNLIHRTNAAGFRSLLVLIISRAREQSRLSENHRRLFLKLLQAVTTTRKGSRIENWEQVITALLNDIYVTVPATPSDGEDLIKLSLSAAILQYAPMDQLLPNLNNLLKQSTDGLVPKKFFAFCDLVATMGRQRFQDLLLPFLQKYIIKHWKASEVGLSYLLKRLHDKHVLSTRPTEAGYISVSKDQEREMLIQLEKAFHDYGFDPLFSHHFQIMAAIDFPKDHSVRSSLTKMLRTSLQDTFSRPHAELTLRTRLSLGWAFQCYLKLETPETDQWITLWQNVLHEQREIFFLVPFLDSVTTVGARIPSIITVSSELNNMQLVLTENLLSDDITLRKKTLEILLCCGQLSRNEWLVNTAGLLLELLNIPYTLDSVRQIEMLIRNLPSKQTLVNIDSPLRKLVPLFTMGMLRSYHDQTRRALYSALSQMVLSGNAEDTVVEIATQWLSTPGILNVEHTTNKSDQQPAKLSPFECSNLNSIRKSGGEIYQQHLSSQEHLQEEFKQAHQLHPSRTPADSRSLALQLFLQIPEVAEKRSRILVPVYLVSSHGKTNYHIPQSDESTSSHTLSPETDEQHWSIRERKQFLQLLSKFINPKVLYRSSEVYASLLELLTNGNPEFRKLALTALLNWKDASLRQYEDVLLRVAEEVNATTELALLLSNSDESGSIKINDRDAVLPVLLRLVFGQIVGRAGTHGPQDAKRKSILRLLFRMEEREINLFLEIAQGRLGEVSIATSSNIFPANILLTDIVSLDQQYGFSRMMLSVLEILQSQFAPYGEKVAGAVIYCTARACHQINGDPEDANTSSGSALARNIRRTGLQCIILLAEHCPDLDWSPYLTVIFSEVISPRLSSFAIENAQGVSVLLRLFSTWAKSPRLCSLLQSHDERLLGVLLDILPIQSARDDVKLFVVDQIIAPLVELSASESPTSQIASMIVSTQIDPILRSIASALSSQASKEVLLAITRLIPALAPYATTLSTADHVLKLLVTLLCEPNQRVPPHIKGSLLRAAESLLQSGTIQLSTATRDKLYETIAELYSYFKDQPNRTVVGKVLRSLCRNNEKLLGVVIICEGLNTQSTTRLDQVDYEHRLAAFNAINELVVSEGTKYQWLPILHNLIYFARTADDFAIRSNAVNCLKKYVTEACRTSNKDMQGLVRIPLLTAFKKGIREDSELVRADFVALFGLIVRELQEEPDLQDLKVLLVGGDEEASFFANILHIQQHRRLRAIRRLLSEIEHGKIGPSNISGFCFPLLEKFINDDSSDESAQGVKGQSIAATAVLLQWIDWKNFRRIFRQYKQDLVTGSRSEKDTIKLLHNAADALTSTTDAVASSNMNLDQRPCLAKTLPPKEVIREELKTNFIPRLADFIHHKDEAQISLRIPAAQVTVKLIKLLASEEIPLLVAPILLDISQILRSRTQESRDTARNTLAGIVQLMGPSSVHFVLKELRTTLTRGYQLHVLSYTMHTILVASAPHHELGDLDYCIEDLVAVVMDDIFGVVGQEKENQDYISSMKEVKSSKSFDSMELLAKSTSVQAMSMLVTPFRSLLMGNLTTKQIRHVDELLRRLGVGIAHNPDANSRDLLVFAYELIQAFYKQKAAVQNQVLTNAEKNRQRYIVQLESAHKMTKGSSTTLLFKIARFALDIVRSTLLKHQELSTAENVHGFLPVIGDALIEGQEDVKISALRLLAAVIKLPLAELNKNAELYVMEAVKVVKGSISTNEEASQAALKLVTAILRERRDVQVRDSDISYLLHRTMPDLEEPDRQGVTFNFIKSVMARNYELPEVYELVDKIGIMMVTSQTRNSRDAARGVYVHFLLDYPQSKNRWSKQLKFLVKNLEFQYPEGRQSVMEAIHVFIQKVGSDMAQELVSTFFIPTVLRMANDDNAQCRELAGALLSRLYRKADQVQLKALLEPLRAWADQTDNSNLTKVSLQAWAVFFDVAPAGSQAEVPTLRSCILRALQAPEIEEDDWEQHFHALELLQKLVNTYPAALMSPKQRELWTVVCSLIYSHHSWVQSSAATLISFLFQDCLSIGAAKVPLVTSQGLRFDSENVLNILRSSVRVLKRNEASTDLATKTLQNLLFLGKYVDSNSMVVKVKERQGDEVIEGVDQDDSGLSDSNHSDDEPETRTKSIPALQYLLDQCVHILRREPSKLTTTAFLPRLSSLNLLTTLIPNLPKSSLPSSTMTVLLIPLTHITDPSMQAPRSADITFPQTYADYTAASHALLEAVQSKLGDVEYVRLMTDVSKIVRARREGRRQKRAIERVTEPERAAKYKQRKVDRKKDRKKEVKDMYRKKRRGDLGF